MVDSRLMGEFEADVKELEADSWSLTVDKKYLKQLKKDVIKRQDVIYGRIECISISLFISICYSVSFYSLTLTTLMQNAKESYYS